MFLDLSNGYGQTDRELLRKQVAQGTNLQWAWEQQHQLYDHISTYITSSGRGSNSTNYMTTYLHIITAVGISLACSVVGGLI